MRYTVSLNTCGLKFSFTASEKLIFCQLLLMQLEMDRLTWEQYEFYKHCYEAGVTEVFGFGRNDCIFQREI